MPTNAQINNSMQVFNQNLRRTNLGINFGRALFSNGNFKLSPQTIAKTLRTLGLNIPPGAVIALDAAQVITSGAALYTAEQTYQGFSDINSVLNASADTIGAVVQLGLAAGWFDKNNQYVQMAEVGSDLYMIYASGGMDVLAYVSLAMQLCSFGAQNQANATQLAQSNVTDMYKQYIGPQYTAAAQVFQQYQQSQTMPDGTPGKLTVFGYMGEMAKAAPTLFPTFFPKAGWMPSTTIKFQSNTTSRTWYGDSAGGNAELYVKTLYTMSTQQIGTLIFNNMILPTLYPFKLADTYFTKQGNVRLFTVALLSSLSGLRKIGKGYDLSAYLKQAYLTPYDFGETFFQDYLKNAQSSDAGLITSSALSGSGGFNFQGGLDARTSQQKSFDLVAKNKDFFSQADVLGKIDVLMSEPSIQTKMRQAFTFGPIPYDQAVTTWNETPESTMDGRASVIVAGTASAEGNSWRDMPNFFGTMGFVSMVMNDPFFRDQTDLVPYLKKTFPYLANIPAFSYIHSQLHLKQVLRSVNSMAKVNIANFFGTTTDKLIKNVSINKNDPVTYSVRNI